jgi:hypothetical protein
VIQATRRPPPRAPGTPRRAAARTAYQAGAAARFVAERLTRGEVGFSLAELERDTGLSRIAARHQLLRLGGRVRRVAPRQPFFLVVDEAHRPMGAPPAAWWLDAYFRFLGRPYYLALASAAAAYGASPQAVQVVQVITDRPRRPLSLGRIRVRFYVKRAAARTPVTELPGAYAPLRVATPEATAIDLVRYAQALGGIDRAVETLRPLAARLKRPALRAALEAEGELASAQRLGFILDRLGYQRLADTVERALPRRLAQVRLDSGAKGGSHRFEPDRRWGLLVGNPPFDAA